MTMDDCIFCLLFLIIVDAGFFDFQMMSWLFIQAGIYITLYNNKESGIYLRLFRTENRYCCFDLKKKCMRTMHSSMFILMA